MIALFCCESKQATGIRRCARERKEEWNQKGVQGRMDFTEMVVGVRRCPRDGER
jgi:hypothetical protein